MVKQAERDAISQALKETSDKKMVAEKLEISLSTLYEKINEYHL